MPCAEVERLIQYVQDALEREEKFKPTDSTSYFECTNKDNITQSQRDLSVRHLLKINQHFHFEPESFAIATNVIDRFLGLVKAHPKYLHCIVLTSLYIAAKFSEEDEFIPTISDFIVVSRSPCTKSDLLRMEKVILQKLDWKLFYPTPIILLKKFCKLLVALGCIPSDFAYSLMIRCLPIILKMLCQYSFVQHKGSVLVLALLRHEVASVNSSISQALDQICHLAKIDDGALIHCYGMIQDFMDLQLVNIRHKGSRSRKRRKRCSSNSIEILPTIEEAGNEEPVIDESSKDNECSKVDECSVNKGNEVSAKDPEPAKDLPLPYSKPKAKDNDTVDKWIDNKKEFPKITGTVTSPKKKAYGKHRIKTGCKQLSKPLYSAVVKMSCSTYNAHVIREHYYPRPRETFAY